MEGPDRRVGPVGRALQLEERVRQPVPQRRRQGPAGDGLMRRLLPSRLAGGSLCVAVLAVSLLWAGSASATTRTEYVVRADPLCASSNHDLGELYKHFRRLDQDHRYGPAGRVATKAGRRLSRLRAQLRAIAPPPGDEQTIATWLSLIASRATDLRKVGRSEAHQNFHAVSHFQAKYGRTGNRADVLMES